MFRTRLIISNAASDIYNGERNNKSEEKGERNWVERMGRGRTRPVHQSPGPSFRKDVPSDCNTTLFAADGAPLSPSD